MTLAHITLATRDIEATRKFLETALGWHSIHRPNNIPMRAAWLAISPSVECHLIEVPDYAPSAFEREYGRHVALAYPLAEFPAPLKERFAQDGGRDFAIGRPPSSGSSFAIRTATSSKWSMPPASRRRSKAFSISQDGLAHTNPTRKRGIQGDAHSDTAVKCVSGRRRPGRRTPG